MEEEGKGRGEDGKGKGRGKWRGIWVIREGEAGKGRECVGKEEEKGNAHKEGKGRREGYG